MIQKKVNKLLRDLETLIYPLAIPVSGCRMVKTTERFADVENLDTSGWQEAGAIWGGHREYFWFVMDVTIPPEMDGQCAALRIITGKEGVWDATNPQFMLFVNGAYCQGLDTNHTEAILTEHARAGEQFHILLSAFTGDNNFDIKLDASLRALDRRTEKYYYDIKVPYDVAMLLPRDNAAHIEIMGCLNASLNLLDLRQEHSDTYYTSLAKAQEYLTLEFYEKHCGSKPAIYCVGHTHIDVAWLWTLGVTKDKAQRSFATMLELMRQYPEFVFMSSQPQLYQYVKENAPLLYEEIKRRVAEGRWEPEGGMWVEADCNLASGESLVRQFLHGKRFFREEFGCDNVILWLPDVFGYSAALPQIMKKCGIRYFMTTKISWNDTNKIPYDTFQWEGLDGTRVLTHFIPAQRYTDPSSGKEPPANTTYNGVLAPDEILGSWRRYQQKNLNSEAMMSFGYGDGGGGPTREMLENQRRLAKGIPGAPRTVMSTARNFFETLEKNVAGQTELPTWVGELYLEYHRGTYTSMARNKKYNRKSEFAYQNAELYAVMNKALTDAEYPVGTLREGWEMILLNQFHDILPGSSIKEVYDESKEQYETILEQSGGLIAGSLCDVAEHVNAPESSLVVFNPNSVADSAVVSFAAPAGIGVVFDGERALAVQKLEDGTAIFTALGVPSKGYKTFMVKDSAAPAVNRLQITNERMENSFFILELNEKGQFTSIYDKKAGRQLLPQGRCGNVLMSYEDRPFEYDAWELSSFYPEKAWEIDAVADITVAESGPVRATLKTTRPYLSSTVTQYISLYADIPRIDIRNEIDWKEKDIVVRCLFPADIHASDATFDIQYGNVTRPTHTNTSWDAARFEVCAHKWLDFSEDGYGLSVLNDCKYGCDVHDGVIGLTMLKSSVVPNPEADKEHHSFTYSLLPHRGGWRDAGTVTQAYLLNNPMTAILKTNDGGTLPPVWSLVTCDAENVVIEAVKKAEDSTDIVVRVYECHNRRTKAALRFGVPVKAVFESDMMEENETPVVFGNGLASFEMKPYEIKTFKLKA